MHAWCARLSAKVDKYEPGTGYQPMTPAAEGGSRPVPLPVTPADLPGKELDDDVDNALGLDGDRLRAHAPFSTHMGSGMDISRS